MVQIVTLLTEAIHFLAEPLDCTANPTARRLRSAAAALDLWSAVPWAQPLVEATCRLACDFRLRPALSLSLVAAVFLILVVTLRNACVNLWRWYAAARGSAFVAVATRALRELHANGALFEVAGGAGCRSDAAAAAAGPRPAACHRWYIPPAVTAPVVCCGCFQPVVVAQGAEGQAQCCELCGMVAHGSCFKAVPHNCRLLALPAPPPDPDPPATAAAGARAGGTPPPPLPHDWRPAGTTLDLILPPADTEMLLGGSDTGGGGGGSSATHGSSSWSASHGPSSLCLYCGEPCEVGLLAVEPVWRCGGCRRFAHVQCWSVLHPGALSAATRAALEGQTWEAEEITGSPRGSSPPWDPLADGAAVQDPRGGGGDVTAGEPPVVTRPLATARNCGQPPPPPPPGCAAAAAARVPGQSARAPPVAAPTPACANGGGSQPSKAPPADSRAGPAGGGSGGSKGSATAAASPPGSGPAAAASVGSWDRQRRCQSLPDIAGQGNGGGSRGSAGGRSDANQHAAAPAGGRTPGGRGEGAASTSTSGAGGGGGGVATASPAAAAGRGPCPSHAASGGGVAAAALRWPPGDSARLSRLDRCDPQASLGPLGAMVLPPTAVIPTIRRSSIFNPASKALAAPAGAAAGGSGGNAAAGGAGGGGGGRGGRKKHQLGRSLRQQAQKWYRTHATGWSLSSGAAADAAAPERWRHFRLGLLPPGCRPLLVFINPRSGPQAGDHLRRQLLQLLHPMQVVDLVREAPGAALRCWWGVPGLRVLVVGGDGTAGWILGEMEAVAGELAAAAAQQQQQGSGEADSGGNGGAGAAAAVAPPPPLAVLPLGTGNDLARVLGWGGGLAALDARGGMAAVLAEVVTAAATPLDRWALAIAATPPEPPRRRSSFLPRRRQQPAAAAAAAKAPTPPVVKVKVFNNYLGVGIDSWCALEFHRMRERYPGWFKSQLGNKMWYTGVGARDLLARSCVDLPSRLQLICDGVPVELPPSTQGVLLLNIPSYMGGVDLWGNGVSHQLQQQQGQLLQLALHGAASAPPLLRDGAAAAAPAAAVGGLHRPSGAAATATTEAPSPDRPLGPHSMTAASAAGPQQGASAGAAAAGLPGAAARRGGSGGSASGAAPSAGGRGSMAETIAAPPTALPPQAQQQPQQPQQLLQSHATLQPLFQQQPQQPQVAPQCHPEVPQSISDGALEVVVVYGAVHLGQLQVGLARATRLCQCRTAVITTRQPLPMQVDGEPWMQPAAQLTVSLKGRSLLLRRLDPSSATSRLTAAVGEVLDGAVARGTISAAQRQALGAELAQRLGAPHAL